MLEGTYISESSKRLLKIRILKLQKIFFRVSLQLWKYVFLIQFLMPFPKWYGRASRTFKKKSYMDLKIRTQNISKIKWKLAFHIFQKFVKTARISYFNDKQIWNFFKLKRRLQSFNFLNCLKCSKSFGV